MSAKQIHSFIAASVNRHSARQGTTVTMRLRFISCVSHLQTAVCDSARYISSLRLLLITTNLLKAYF